MSKKWTEAYPRDNAIVDYKQFNQGYNAFKSSFNGNIDRTMMPASAFNKTRIKDKAFHYVQVFRRGEMQELIDPNTPADSRDFEGLSYNTYGGGWLSVDTFDLDDMKDGMLHWEFSFNVYNNTYHGDNPKSVSIRLLFDGVEVCTAYKMGMPINTYRMVCDFPMTSSPHTVTVQARSVAPSDDENQHTLFTLLSMHHLFIGRWR